MSPTQVTGKSRPDTGAASDRLANREPAVRPSAGHLARLGAWTANHLRVGRGAAPTVMIAVFLTFALSGPLAPKEMGVILAFAIAPDALVVRLVVLPVLLRVGHRHIWYRPPWLARVLPQVRFSH